MIEIWSIPRTPRLVCTTDRYLLTTGVQPSNLRRETQKVLRREFLQILGEKCRVLAATSLGLVAYSGCTQPISESAHAVPDLIIGQRGLAEGRFQKPRAIAIDSENRIFVVDKTGRIQVFDDSGKFMHGWRTPEIESGKPTGISIDVDGTVMVADTHYYRFLFYTANGELLEAKTIGGTNGSEPGQFAFVTDIVRTPTGEFYCGEYGEFDRIHKYSGDGAYMDRMGEHGTGPLQFSRPQSLSVDADGMLWVADACNHRIHVIDWRGSEPRSVAIIGEQGTELGQFQYPYGLVLTEGNSMVVSEFGNHRVQKLDREGRPLTAWGSAGSVPGQLNQPWATAVDSQNRIYVVDSGNNRVQRFRF